MQKQTKQLRFNKEQAIADGIKILRIDASKETVIAVVVFEYDGKQHEMTVHMEGDQLVFHYETHWLSYQALYGWLYTNKLPSELPPNSPN